MDDFDGSQAKARSDAYMREEQAYRASTTPSPATGMSSTTPSREEALEAVGFLCQAAGVYHSESAATLRAFIERSAPEPAKALNDAAPCPEPAKLYAERHNMAVTRDWMVGWDACRNAWRYGHTAGDPRDAEEYFDRDGWRTREDRSAPDAAPAGEPAPTGLPLRDCLFCNGFGKVVAPPTGGAADERAKPVRILTDAEVRSATAPYVHHDRFGIVPAVLRKFCEVNGLALSSSPKEGQATSERKGE